MVSIALTLGDAGTAIEHARAITSEGTLLITERQVALQLDMARAYCRWGKYDRALDALYSAERLAPEELASRPSVRALVHDTAQHAPPTMQRAAHNLAERIGAAL